MNIRDNASGLTWVVLVILAALPLPVGAQASFTGLGAPAGDESVSVAAQVSANGAAAVDRRIGVSP